MDVKEFFRMAKEICDRNYYDCRECPITDYCCDGVFAADEYKVAEIVDAVENAVD
jgi:hypothetical protein